MGISSEDFKDEKESIDMILDKRRGDLTENIAGDRFYTQIVMPNGKTISIIATSIIKANLDSAVCFRIQSSG